MDIGKLLTTKTGPLPNWGWLVAIVVGGGVAWYFMRQSGSTSQTGSSNGTANAGLPDTIDPLTGVPYAVEQAINPNTGLPAYYGGAGVTNTGTNGGTTSTNPTGQNSSNQNPGSDTSGGSGTAQQTPPAQPRQTTTVGTWPNWNGSLSGIASHYGLSLERLEGLNPQFSSNWNLIYPGQTVYLS
jgi:hypothetical protein